MRLLYALLILTGCGYNNTKIPADVTAPSGGGNNGTAATLDFATIKSQVFQNYCIRCHSLAGGNKAGVNLEDYSNVKPIIQTILSAVNSGFMPQSGTLPTAAKMLLANWVQAGSPEFSNGPTDNTQNPDPNPITAPCDDHRRDVQDELIQRDDNCEDRMNETIELLTYEGI